MTRHYNKNVTGLLVGLGQEVLQFLVLGLDGPHRRIDGFPQILAFRQLLERREPRRFRQGQVALGVIVGLADPPAPCPALRLPRQLHVGLGEPAVGVTEENQPQDRPGELRRPETGIRPQLIRRRPEPFLDVVIGDHVRA